MAEHTLQVQFSVYTSILRDSPSVTPLTDDEIDTIEENIGRALLHYRKEDLTAYHDPDECEGCYDAATSGADEGDLSETTCAACDGVPDVAHARNAHEASRADEPCMAEIRHEFPSSPDEVHYCHRTVGHALVHHCLSDTEREEG